MPRSSGAAADSDLPPGLSRPALRAFAAAGYTRLADFTRVSEAALLALHGVGPKAIHLLRPALATRGLTFADDASWKPGTPPHEQGDP